MTKEPNNSRRDGDLGRPIREIVYLDLNRVTSYLSQIHDGLSDYFDLTGTSSIQEGQQGTQFNVGRGAMPFGVTFGRKDTSVFDTTTLVERKRDHHAALTVLENVLERKDILGNIEAAKPFIKHVGQPILIDYPYIAKRFRSFKALRAALQAIADLDKEQSSNPKEQKIRTANQARERAETQKRFDDFATVMEASEGRLEFFYDEPKITVPLVRDFLQLPSEMIEHLYGVPSRIPMTLIGLDVTGKETAVGLETGDNMAASTAFITNEYYRLVGKHFRYGDSYKKIVPIALYIEADAGSTD